MITTGITNQFSHLIVGGARWYVLAVLVLLASLFPRLQADEGVNVIAFGTPNEENESSGYFMITRDNTNLAVSINLTITGGPNVIYTSDYTVVGLTNIVTSNGGRTVTATLDLADGVSSGIVTITAEEDNAIEGGEAIKIQIETGSYIRGNSTSAQLTIGDNDTIATITQQDNVAEEDTLFASLNYDPNYGRRGVFRVGWEAAPGATGSLLTRNVRARFAVPVPNANPNVPNMADPANDYVIHYKISADPDSYIGCVITDTETTGLGYKVYAYLIGEDVIEVTGGDDPIAVGSSVRFGDSLATYEVTAATISNGTGSITIDPPLSQNLTNDLSVTVLLGGGGDGPTGYVLNAPIKQGDTEFKIASGLHGLYPGDVFRVGDDTGNFYVVTDFTPIPALSTSGRGLLEFRRYIFDGSDGGSGLSADIEGTASLETLFAVPAGTTVFAMTIPAESTRIEFSIVATPGDGAEGRETVTMTLDSIPDYDITDPTSSTLIIADADVVATIVSTANAQKPTTSGNFRVTLDQALPKNTVVRYFVTPTTVSPDIAIPGTDYETLSGSVTILAGQTIGDIEVKPINSAAFPSGFRTVTTTLNTSNDFLQAGSTGSVKNASATLNITDSRGTVSIAAGTTDAQEGTPAVSGQFTITLTRPPATSGNVNVRYTVSGSADPERYVALGSVNINGSATTATLTLTPVNNSKADGTEDVIITLDPGDGYGLSTTLPISASLRILDDEPTVAVTAAVDASKGGAAGRFTIAYPGVPAGTLLGRSLRVFFEFSGDAVYDTDFTTNAEITETSPTVKGYIDIPAVARSVDVSIIGGSTPADGSDKTLVLTILPDPAYSIHPDDDSGELEITGSPTPTSSKPTPGSIDSGSSGGGCGLGSGLSALLGLAAFAFLALRRRA